MTTVTGPIPPTTSPTAGPPGVEADPLLAPPSSMPESPLLASEQEPVLHRRDLTLLDVSPVARHMENLDALRILCMVGIIITHVTVPFLDFADQRHERGPTFLATFALSVACRFGVPCFMMISFFIYWHQLYEKGRSWGELLKRRFKRLAPAFICWSSFYYLAHKLLYKRYGTLWNTTLWDFNWHHWRWVIDVFVLGKAEYHLYYLPLVMECLLLIPLLRLLWKRPLMSWGWVALTLAWWSFMIYGEAFAAPHSHLRALTDKINVYCNEETALPALVFPLVGMMCAGQKAWRNLIVNVPNWAWAIGILLGMALHAGECIYLLPHNYVVALTYLKLGRLVSSLCIFAMIVRHPLMRDPFPRISHYAFGLHFMHPAIILILSMLELRFLGPAFHEWRTFVVPMLALNFVLTFYITFGLCLAMGRFKRLEFLIV